MTKDTSRLGVGDPAPHFVARAPSNPTFTFHAIAGRNMALTFIDSAASDAGRGVLGAIHERSAPFDDVDASWFIVTADDADETSGRLPLRLPGIRAFFDGARAIHGLYGIDAANGRPVTMLISPRLQIVGVIDERDPVRHAEQVFAKLAEQPRVERLSETLGPAPILIIPNVFERDLCKTLIAGYEANGGTASGFMREEGGKTVRRFDDKHKVRKDWNIEDKDLLAHIQNRFVRCVVPEIRKAYNFHVTRMERYIVSCYDAAEGGHFNPHRDNTTKGTAHRRFACSINLNAEEFEGGNLRFPEFGRQTYRPPTGGCVIFGCSLLHEATLVTKGRRYAFLPFLYDDAAARIRAQNAQFLERPAEPAALAPA